MTKKRRWYVSPNLDGSGGIGVVAEYLTFQTGGAQFSNLTGLVQVTSSFYPYHSFAVLWHDDDYDPTNPSY